METAVETPRTRSDAGDINIFRIGGMAGIAGGVLAIVANVLHPRLAPRDLGKPDKMLDMISGYSLWKIDHLAVVVSAVLALLALVAAARSILHTRAEPWARFALGAAIATGAVSVVAFAIDGSVVAGIAEEWKNTSGSARADVLNRFALVQYFDVAFFSMAVFGLFGATQLLYGIALRESRSYPGWIGTSAIVGGVLGLVSGAWMWMAGALTIGNFLILFTITSVVFTIWLIAVSWRMLRMSESSSELVA